MLLQVMLNCRIFKSTAIAPLLLCIPITITGCSLPSKAQEPNLPQRDAIASYSQDDLVAEVHRGVNQYRQSLNLPPLRLNAQISQQAQNHSQNMAQQEVKFSHRGFDSRLEAIKDRIDYRSAAENVASNQGYDNPAARAVKGWIESDRHRQNMIGDYNLTGIGVAQNQQGKYYFTQIFIEE